MSSLYKWIFLLSLILNFGFTYPTVAESGYPKMDSIYSRDEILSLFQEYETKVDTIGLLYTIGLYHSIQTSYDSINIKYFPFLIRNIERMKAHSPIDYYRLRIIILSFYIKSDVTHLKQAAIICREVQDVAEKKGWDKLILETLFLNYKIYQLTEGSGRESEFFAPISRFAKYENQINDVGLLYNFYAAIWYLSNNQYTKSIFHFKKTESVAAAINNDNLNLTSTLYICQINRLLQNYDESLAYGLKASKMSESTLIIDLQRWTHEELAFVYESGFKNYQEANEHWKQYFKLIKRLQTIDHATAKLPDLQLQLIEERLSSENKQLNLQNQFISKNLKSQNVILKLSFSIALLVAVIAIMMYIWAKQYRVATENSKYLVINEARELERQKISQELHDSVGGNIFAIKSYIPDKVPNYQQIINHLDNTYDQIRQTSHILSTNGIAEVGLIESCQDFVKLFSDKIDIDLQIHGEPIPMSDKFSVQLYRIIQEIILNAIKHSEASQMFLSFYFDKPKIMVNIEDNGKGFDTTKHYGGLGLANVRHNVKLLQGTLELTSSEKGTIYWIEFHTKRI